MERSDIRGNLTARDPAFRFAQCGLRRYALHRVRTMELHPQRTNTFNNPCKS